MKFTLQIEVGNDAVQGEGDVAQLLRNVATHLCAGGSFFDFQGQARVGTVRDVNGNKVGRWEVIDDDG